VPVSPLFSPGASPSAIGELLGERFRSPLLFHSLLFPGRVTPSFALLGIFGHGLRARSPSVEVFTVPRTFALPRYNCGASWLSRPRDELHLLSFPLGPTSNCLEFLTPHVSPPPVFSAPLSVSRLTFFMRSLVFPTCCAAGHPVQPDRFRSAP